MRGLATKVGEAFGQLLNDRRSQPGVGDEIRAVGPIDDERGAAVEPIGASAADPEPAQLVVPDPALHRGALGTSSPADEPEGARAERQPSDEGLPVRLSPLDRVGRHSDLTVGLVPTSGIRGGHERRCGLPADRSQGVSRGSDGAVPVRAKMTRTLRPS